MYQLSQFYFFESPSSRLSLINYRKTTISIINTAIKNDYKVYIKPHPSKGYSDFLDQMDVTIVPALIPAELLEISIFKYVLGINSLSIARLSMNSENKIFSLINIYKWKDFSEKEQNINNLNIKSCDKIIFVNSLNCFDKLFKSTK